MLRHRRRHMGRGAKAFYYGTLLMFCLLAAGSVYAGLWIHFVLSVVLGAIFYLTAPIVLAWAGRRPEDEPTRRPVVRKRRY